jgi:hypothetical protein
MKLTRDEARILSYALFQAKYEDGFCTKEQFAAVTDLEHRLEDAGKDERRKGRMSQNDWKDMMKRFDKKYQKSKQ